MSQAAVRDLREVRDGAGPEELVDFETDVLAGFVLARAAAGLSDGTISSESRRHASPKGERLALGWGSPSSRGVGARSTLAPAKRTRIGKLSSGTDDERLDSRAGCEVASLRGQVLGHSRQPVLMS